MATNPNKHGGLIGQIETLTRVYAYCEDGTILYHKGGNWRIHSRCDNIHAAYRIDKLDQDSEDESLKAFRKLFHSCFHRKNRWEAMEMFKLYSHRSCDDEPVIGDSDAFYEDACERFGEDWISRDDSRRLFQYYLQHRLSAEHRPWAIYVRGSTPASILALVMVGRLSERQERMQFIRELYSRPHAQMAKVTMRPAKLSEIRVYTACGNPIWKSSENSRTLGG